MMARSRATFCFWVFGSLGHQRDQKLLPVRALQSSERRRTRAGGALARPVIISVLVAIRATMAVVVVLTLCMVLLVISGNAWFASKSLKSMHFSLERQSRALHPNNHELTHQSRPSRQSILAMNAQPNAYRHIVKVLSTAIMAISLTSTLPAQAVWFPSAEQKEVSDINAYEKTVTELYDELTPRMQPNSIGVFMKMQTLKGGKDDSDVVQVYVDNYLKPLQQKMASNVKHLKLANADDQKRLEVLPQLMLGHILELQQAIQAQNAVDQRKEVQEVLETLTEYLGLVKQGGYEVQEYIRPGKAVKNAYNEGKDASNGSEDDGDMKAVPNDKELFGPLSCEWWGKVRVEGSNACTEKK